MAEACEDVLKFVLLVEQHNDVLLKSQTSLNKEKKKAADLSIIKEWEEISQTKLTDASLLKKISNLKTRARVALNNGKPINEWQTKILSFGNEDTEVRVEDHLSNQACADASDVDTGISLAPPNGEINAETILDQFETDQTKLMSNDQLQRFVLLQKVHVLTLQRKRLEFLTNIDNAKNVPINYIGFHDGIIDENVNPTFENL